MLLGIYLPVQKEIAFESRQHLKNLLFLAKSSQKPFFFPYNLLFYITTYFWCDFFGQLFTFIR